MPSDSVRNGNTALNVAGLERSKSWSRNTLGMESFGGVCGDLLTSDDDEDLFDSGDGDGVVSLDDPPDAIEADDEGNVEAPAVNLCLI